MVKHSLWLSNFASMAWLSQFCLRIGSDTVKDCHVCVFDMMESPVWTILKAMKRIKNALPSRSGPRSTWSWWTWWQPCQTFFLLHRRSREKARVFVGAKYFQSSLIFSTEPNHGRVHYETSVHFQPYLKYRTWLKVLDKDKHSSLFFCRINDEEKTFCVNASRWQYLKKKLFSSKLIIWPNKLECFPWQTFLS